MKLKTSEPHPKTAVHGRDEHDGQQDNETGDEEADHQVGAAEDTDGMKPNTHDVAAHRLEPEEHLLPLSAPDLSLIL